MYKILYKNMIIDVVDNIRYAKYLSNCNRTVITNKTCANCIIGSNNKDRYHLKGMPYPDGCDFKTVSAIKIDEKEYNDLQNKIKSNSTGINNYGINIVKKNKIQEMSKICHDKIIDGFRVQLSDGELHHFELSIEDQLNLLEIKSLLESGQKSFIYHETDGIYKEFSSEDMYKILKKAFEHKQQNLLYFNKLKNHIHKLNNINDISNIKYGVKI